MVTRAEFSALFDDNGRSTLDFVHQGEYVGGAVQCMFSRSQASCYAPAVRRLFSRPLSRRPW